MHRCRIYYHLLWERSVIPFQKQPSHDHRENVNLHVVTEQLVFSLSPVVWKQFSMVGAYKHAARVLICFQMSGQLVHPSWLALHYNPLPRSMSMIVQQSTSLITRKPIAASWTTSLSPFQMNKMMGYKILNVVEAWLCFALLTFNLNVNKSDDHKVL